MVSSVVGVGGVCNPNNMRRITALALTYVLLEKIVRGIILGVCSRFALGECATRTLR